MRTSLASSDGWGTSLNARGFLNSCRTAAFMSHRKFAHSLLHVSASVDICSKVARRTWGTGGTKPLFDQRAMVVRPSGKTRVRCGHARLSCGVRKDQRPNVEPLSYIALP